MGTATELVHRYAQQLEPCTPPYDESTRQLEYAYKSFIVAVQQLNDPVVEIRDALPRLHDETDWRYVNLWLMAAIEHPDATYVPELCALLMHRGRYIQHEWIAELLGDIGDSNAISALVDTCSAGETLAAAHSLAHRCIDSLQQIATPESKAAIETLAQFSIEHIRLYASGDW